jgi:hypothetical protein
MLILAGEIELIVGCGEARSAYIPASDNLSASSQLVHRILSG